ncbi:death ligand signal enhancer [Polymixia lowei]
MWRVQGLVGRVLNRRHGNAPLRLSQNHHVEDEAINGSTVLSTSRQSADSSSQNREDGERRRKKRTSQFCYAGLPRYTALDAVGWGAAAALFMQICRRIHSHLSSGSEASPSPTPGPLAVATLHKCGYRILLEILSRRDVLPRGRSVVCLHGVPERHNQGQSQAHSDSDSSSDAGHQSTTEHDHLMCDSSFSDQQRADLSQEAHSPEESASSPQQHQHSETDGRQTTVDNDKDVSPDEERLAGAALNLRHVADSSVPVILNIIGLESVKSENHEAAFSCFLAAAQHDYSKAQFNTGVCYERGCGVRRDKDKALHYYWQAAIRGHNQARYRYAKLLLASRGRQSTEELNTAISLLEQAATAGLTEAQVFLGSVFSQEPVRDECKSVHYLKMAAERGDSTALLFLGQCFESGFGVKQNLMKAIEFYKKAAQAGNSQAKSLLMPPRGPEEEAMLRSIRSAPCFPVSNRLYQPLFSLAGPAPPSNVHPVTLPLLPHSWSTGSLGSPPPSLSSMPLHPQPHHQAPGTEGGPCRWTLGIG